MLGVYSGGVHNCLWLAVPQPTKWQRIGDKIDAAMIFARSNFVNVLWVSHRNGQRLACSVWLSVIGKAISPPAS
jgi:hypothetical protein